jgi:hypothetical protein
MIAVRIALPYRDEYTARLALETIPQEHFLP